MNRTRKRPGNDPVRLVVVGGGRIGEVHARNALRLREKVRLAAIVEPKPSATLRRVADAAGVEITGDFAQVAGQTDAVLIASPTDLHEMTLARAAEMGIDVFCEKPLAGDLPAARRMVATAERAGIVLQVGFNRRFDHNYRGLRSAVTSGAVGQVELVRVTSRDPAPPSIEYVRRSGGLFMDMMIHDFDMVRFLTGDEIETVFARGASLVDPAIGEAGDVDTSIVTLRLRNGALGVIENSRRATYGYDQRAEIHGSRGAAESANDNASRVTISDVNGIRLEKPLYFFIERYEQSFLAELTSFVNSVQGGAAPEVDGTDGLQAMRVAEACRRSLVRREEVALSEVE